MVNPTRTSSPFQTKICIEDAIEVLLNISKQKYDIPYDSLFQMAARQNKKREFLFVSKVLGKHIPIKPLVLRLIGGILSRLWMEEYLEVVPKDIDVLVNALLELLNKEDPDKNTVDNALMALNNKINLNKKTLFIGFAETATGIAQAVFSNFNNAAYIHTTREEIEGVEPDLLFKEEHSHAVDQVIYSKDKDFLSGFEYIVLIDDELTTGKTALNLIKHLPISSFSIITILDWREDEHIKLFENKIKVCSLIKGNFKFRKLGQVVDETFSIGENFAGEITCSDVVLNSSSMINEYLEYTGRFGLSSEKLKALDDEMEAAGKILSDKRIKGNCLCLGTEEFIYLPCIISSMLGDNVFFHSTTRSPIYSINKEGSCIKSKVLFNRPFDKSVKNYLYNIPKDFYYQVFIFSEKAMNRESKDTFKKIFSNFNIKDVVFVSWN